MRLRPNLSPYFALALVTAALLASPLARAGKFEASLGGYQFSATNKRNNTSSTLSGFGSYRIAYHHDLPKNFEFDAGYSLIATKGIGGDLSFGFDLGVNYFPLTKTGTIELIGEGMQGSFHQSLRPFVGIAFHQRNFQSTSSQYAGVGVKLGTEYQINNSLSGLGYLRVITLGGPNQSSATQTELLIGGVYQIW